MAQQPPVAAAEAVLGAGFDAAAPRGGGASSSEQAFQQWLGSWGAWRLQRQAVLLLCAAMLVRGGRP